MREIAPVARRNWFITKHIRHRHDKALIYSSIDCRCDYGCNQFDIWFFIDKNEPVVITSFTVVNRYKLHLYDNYDWAEEHFKEFELVKTQYKSYLGWRRVPYRGTTITIEEDGCRSHLHDQDDNMPTIWFFGGSTMWGTGVSDKYTIPAIFQKKNIITIPRTLVRADLGAGKNLHN